MTIITVTHDAHRFVELCIKAVHKFTQKPYEHVIIDNGSQPETINFLTECAKKEWITLHRRNVSKNATGHAVSLNWFLSSHHPGLVCLLDSDAFPVSPTWLEDLQEHLKGYDATGFSHFRDEKLLHPSCMLFKYSSFALAGKPSFMIRHSNVFLDTGMIVCQQMVKSGSKLKPLNKEAMRNIVSHRWCATRFENAKGDKIDDTPKERYSRETDLWFDNTLIKEILISE